MKMTIGDITSFKRKNSIKEFEAAFPNVIHVDASTPAIELADRVDDQSVDLIIVKHGKRHGVIDPVYLRYRAAKEYKQKVGTFRDTLLAIEAHRSSPRRAPLRLSEYGGEWIHQRLVQLYDCAGPPKHRITDYRCPIHGSNATGAAS